MQTGTGWLGAQASVGLDLKYGKLLPLGRGWLGTSRLVKQLEIQRLVRLSATGARAEHRMAQATQENRTGRLRTPFDEATPGAKDKLLLARFEGSEGLGELFAFRVEALSETPIPNFVDALGRNCSVHLETADKAGRDFSGVLVQAHSLGQRGSYYAYSLTLRPWLWLLSYTSDCRIFANMTPLDIIKRVFESHGFKDYVEMVLGNYPTLEYTVQYRETDLNFVLRLMEAYGIYFYFNFLPSEEGKPGKHVLVLADRKAHVHMTAPKTLFYEADTGGPNDRQSCRDWTFVQTFQSNGYALNDYNYEANADLLATPRRAGRSNTAILKIYNYPGGHKTQDVGKNLAGIMLQADANHYRRWTATGDAPSLTPGYVIDRVSAYNSDQGDAPYLIVRCLHSYGNQAYESGGARGGAAAMYNGTYEFSDPDRYFRMPVQTQKPVVAGLHSAKVIGAENEEIDVDEQGRILLEFYWDRKHDGVDEEKQGKNPSRRVRVAQFWAGSARGALFIPRKGDEVLVQYEDGDVDRPLVVGSAYNVRNPIHKRPAAGQEPVGHTDAIDEVQRRLQHAAVRRHRRRREDQAARGKGPDVQGAEQRTARHRRQSDGEYWGRRDHQCRRAAQARSDRGRRQFHPERLQDARRSTSARTDRP